MQRGLIHGAKKLSEKNNKNYQFTGPNNKSNIKSFYNFNNNLDNN